MSEERRDRGGEERGRERPLPGDGCHCEIWQSAEGNILHVSGACESLSGYPPRDFFDDDNLLSSLVEEEDRPLWESPRQGRSVLRFRIRRRDGTVIPIEETSWPLFGEGHDLGRRFAFRDVTEETKALAALKESEDRFRRVIENLPYPLAVVDGDGTFLYANPSFSELFETSPEALSRGTKASSFWGEPKEREAWLAALREKGVVRDYEIRARTASGRLLWITLSGLFITWQGRLSVLSTQRDVTETKRAREALVESEARLRIILDTIPDGISLTDPDGTIRSVTPKTLQLGGYASADEVVGGNILDQLAPSERERARSLIGERLCGKASGPVEYLLRRKDGSFFHGEINGNVLRDERGEVTGIVYTQRDVTERRTFEAALRESEEKYRLLAESVSDVIWVYNVTRSRFTYVSPSVFRLRGYTAEEAMAQTLAQSLTAESLSETEALIAEGLRLFLENPEENSDHINEICQPCKNGRVVWVEVSTRFRFAADGDIELFCVSRNIDGRKRAEAEVRFLSYHDQLTGLHNRRFYEEEFRRLDDASHLPLSLIMADVNGLKLTNDAFGHQVGDELLRTMASIFREATRPGDVLARIGGDEFVFLLPRSDARAAWAIVERIRSVLKTRESEGPLLSVSFGVATKTKGTETRERLFSDAENRMYRNKLSESDSMKSKTIRLVTQSLYERSPWERGHGERVSRFCRLMGTALGLGPDDVEELALAGLLHDIGKIGVERSLLLNPEQLDEEERNEMRRHPEIGFQILRSSGEFATIAEAVLAHHERFDGKGYPRGKKGKAIPLSARIIALAESYEAMTGDHLYRRPLPKAIALRQIEEEAGRQFDPDLTKIFVDVIAGED
ncbi:PAS domain S-box protein [Aminithiophilus ramosus]|uniref:PAS domain S-box protein n=1 Tax=Aminithiophilus ramosus TaxID=3029084 RepID=A0A9Q7ASB9_9BACT|nr:PAS domain S-box protein [Aminithiophilus ramosus]QTX33066.1 PAS domain S-box protein [Aminithiophilus ramosus]